MKSVKSLFCFVLCLILIFSSNFALASYATDSEVYYDIDEDGVLCVYGDGEMTAKYTDDTTLTEVYIERGITSIPEGAFSGCSNIEKITISNSVESIGSSAFDGCSSLSEIKLSNSITTIADYAFYGCASLTGISIPASVDRIEFKAFYGCSNLQYIILDSSVEFIDENAFKNCTALNKIYFAGKSSDWSNVSVLDDKINSISVTSLSPEIYTEKTYSTGKMILSLKLGSGSFNALDAKFTPVGDCSIYRIQANKSFTASNNRTTGIVSMASNETLEVGNEIIKVTFNVTNCENYSVNFEFLSCTVRVEGYDIDVPVSCDSLNVQGEHGLGQWNVVSAPSATDDGLAEATCSCCGATVQKNLSFAFKNCEVQNSAILIESTEIDEDAFKSEYFLTDNCTLSFSSDYVGTGATVSVDYSDGIILNYDVSILGDVDGDGFCDARDSMIILSMCENMIDTNSLSSCVALASDCNKDGNIDSSDRRYAFYEGIQSVAPIIEEIEEIEEE